jgi:translation initiation factor 2 beta subunit (eIF-2beta)/eIF-5
MVFEWESFFECGTCGTTDRTDAVDYDRLGYAVCPGCGWSDSPLVGAA